jgi:sulfhydrogenase subunit alpha
MEQTSTQDLSIDIHHLTRVEGHGNIVVNLRDGILEQCALQVIEAPRFFEVMLRGRSYQNAPHIASRICGICSVSHSTASLRACENALGIEPSPQTVTLRKLNLMAEMLDSHILHICMLAAPDFLGEGSVIPLAKSAPELVTRTLRMKRLAGDLCAVIGGRHTHPIAMVVGGFAHFPSSARLLALRDRLVGMRADLDATVDLLGSLAVPDFERETEYIALHDGREYSIIDGSISSSDGGAWGIDAYREVTNEHYVMHSTAKHARHRRASYMVGALARFNLDYALLHPRAKEAAAALGIAPPCTNPYMITVAQLVECMHFNEWAIQLIEQLVATGIRPEAVLSSERDSGEGVGACEAPRGTLYHHYEILDGRISRADCVIPTAQNLANIEADMRALVPALLGLPREEIILGLEMLVRAYDPCISCSAHMWEVRII